MADMLYDSSVQGMHRDLRQTEIKRSEELVSTVVETVNAFIIPLTMTTLINLCAYPLELLPIQL